MVWRPCTPAQRLNEITTHEDCKTCERAGLSILLVRPTVIATDRDFAPIGADALHTHAASMSALALPKLQRSRYALRMLRSGGFVYVYYTKKPPQLASQWQAFQVAAQGALIPESQINWSGGPVFACTRNSLHPHDVRTLCVQLPQPDPASAAPMWIGFSMNWWDGRLRQAAAASPADHGMVRIDPLQDLGGVSNAFKADATNLQRYVADFALKRLDHGRIAGGDPQVKDSTGGMPSATAFYASSGTSSTAAEVMRNMAAAHPLTQGREFVLALPDPIGLAADANGLRLVRSRESQFELLRNENYARSEACYNLLQGFRKAIDTAAHTRALDWATLATEKQWNSIAHREPSYTWEAIPNTWGADGSRQGRLTPIPSYKEQFEARIRMTAQAAMTRQWERILGQLDKKRFDAWPANRAAELGRKEKDLAAYEADWLLLADGTAAQGYFARHFDEDDSGSFSSRHIPGLVYAEESNLVHRPQPLAGAHLEQWLELTLGREATDKRAVPLRAGFGNQRSVLAKVHALLIGNWDRSATPATEIDGEIGDIRDKTVDLLKSILTHEYGKRFNWLHPRVMALGAGGTAASAAGLFQLIAKASGQSATGPSVSVNRYRNQFIRLTFSQHQLMNAVEKAGSAGGAPKVTVLLRGHVNVKTARLLLSGQQNPGSKSAASSVSKGLSDKIPLLVLTDYQTAVDIANGRTSAADLPGAMVRTKPNGPGRLSGGAAVPWPTEILSVSSADVAHIAERQATLKELRLNSAEGRLAVGSMAVQFLGLIQAVPQLLTELNKAQWDSGKTLESALGSLDAAGGLLGATMDKWAAMEKASLLLKDGGLGLAESSAKIAALRTGVALTGILGGAITAFLSIRQRDRALGSGDESAAWAFSYSARFSVGSAMASAVMARDAWTGGAVSRTLGRWFFLRTAGAVSAEAAAVAASGAASLISGVGIALLLGSIGAYAIAIALERDGYQRWAGRCYFGDDHRNQFSSSREEENHLNAIFFEADAVAERDRLLARMPAEVRHGKLGEPLASDWLLGGP